MVERIISKAIPNPKIIFKNDELKGFFNKVDIIESLEIIKDKSLIGHLRTINKMRNECAHNLTINKQKMQIWVESLSAILSKT